MKTDISTYGIKKLYWFVTNNPELRSRFATADNFGELVIAVDEIMIYSPLQLEYLKKEFDKHQ